VEKHRQVTEEDIIMTEELITRSYGRLKQSVVQAPSRALRCVGNTLKEHPIPAAGAAVGAGITLYGLFRLMTRQGSVKERVAYCSEKPPGADMKMVILSLIIPIVTPYITDYLGKYVGRIFSEDRDYHEQGECDR
jgi:hypothetical protein